MPLHVVLYTAYSVQYRWMPLLVVLHTVYSIQRTVPLDAPICGAAYKYTVHSTHSRYMRLLFPKVLERVEKLYT